jgi:transcriptional regulator with PAS, ATPase and Fis domain
MEIQSIKQRFGIIGNSPLLNRAIEIAIQVASTDLSVLITGESGSGKENFPKIIHQLGARKHGNYIAVNCGAIPEGTIDSELFGHEKGSFTGATESRKGYFEVADGGTIFLDEVAELPLATQARLLRVLENGEYIRVGSSKVLKTNVRVVAATNVNIPKAIDEGRFREDLYYRLNTVPIQVPALRYRKEDILLLFRKFASDFALKYRMPTIQLNEEATQALINYHWKGNVRQLKNVTEQISIIENNRSVDKNTLIKYLPEAESNRLPVLFRDPKDSHLSERDLLYKVLFEMRRDVNDLKQLVGDMLQNGEPNLSALSKPSNTRIVKEVFEDLSDNDFTPAHGMYESNSSPTVVLDTRYDGSIQDSEVLEESLSLQEKEVEMIKRALKKHQGKRKNAADELGISERTLYRKIKEFDLG